MDVGIEDLGGKKFVIPIPVVTIAQRLILH